MSASIESCARPHNALDHGISELDLYIGGCFQQQSRRPGAVEAQRQEPVDAQLGGDSEAPRVEDD